MTPAKTYPLGWTEASLPVAVLAIVIAMIVPVPPFLMDLLIASNITLSVIVLLVALYTERPVEFSIFPSVLLLMTLFRLALNVSSTRLILLNGQSGTAAAGRMIEAFGNFVVGGSYLVGSVIFLVLIAIQYVVITHGAVRIAEVAARFALDALPGRQMSIDSEFSAGLINEVEARQRRLQLAGEAEFYGAMDGASRFTQRDAVASLIITAINIVGGFLIGVFEHGMGLRRAAETYTVLTIGDGLVTALPALIIAVSGALIMTRAASAGRLGAEFHRQVLGDTTPLLVAAAGLLALGAVPGLPKIPFLLLGAGVGAAAWRRKRNAAAPGKLEVAPAAVAPRAGLEAVLRVDPLAVELGLGLLKLAEGGPESPLLRRIAAIRRELAAELGFIIPSVRVRDNLSLRAREYAVLVRGIEVERRQIHSDRELGAIGDRLAEAIRAHAHELFSREEARKLLDRVAAESPRVAEDLGRALPLAVVQRVLQNLLRERVSIRDAVSILEALSEAAGETKNPVLLTEQVRQAIGRVVVKPYLNQAGELPAYFLDPSLEQLVESAVEHSASSSRLVLAPDAVRHVVGCIQKSVGTLERPAAALAGSGARFFLRRLVEPAVRNLHFLSRAEIPPGVEIVSLGSIQC